MKSKIWIISLTILAILSGCKDSTDGKNVTTETHTYQSVSITHDLGNTVISKYPQRVAVLDMNDVDFLDSLGVPFIAMPKDFIPHYLKTYQNNETVSDIGAIVQPNIEKIYKAKPDLILASPLHDSIYEKLKEISPVLRYDINYKNSQNQVEIIKKHLLDLGLIFLKENQAKELIKKLDNEIKEVRKVTQNSPKTALIILHNNGSLSNFGINSRYGFVFQDLGVKPAINLQQNSLHGYPISSELINQANPDIIYIIDRTAVMEKKSVISKNSIKNSLLENTKAWKSGNIIFVDAEAWYTAAASPSAIKIIIHDVLKGYQQ
ncbi:siderophore ABC transporter substrate-binding protein [Pelistega sp. MC2]|uniref:siderophore ABC transporter substrate-binding protein n=1 Tax=Pelistega sp. MC2 TaxID=1720297 RepID=UPI00115FBEEF|nr:siderophore ABC transporter substrate-binding protein [Pelistega sp. MC2]